MVTVGINRPEKRNCVNHATASELLRIFNELDEDDSVKSIVLYGVGGSFCAGYDLEELSKAGKEEAEQLLPLDRGPMVILEQIIRYQLDKVNLIICLIQRVRLEY